jgi:SAM-dependent methyltransferase
VSPDAYGEMAQVQATHWWYVARRAILRSQLRRMDLPAGADILEIGSGTGANLDLLAEFGHVMGLEMAAAAIALAKNRRSGRADEIVMRQGRCPEDLAAISQRFDLICLFDVLEHIEPDEESLAALKCLLKPGGRLMLTVPAYPWMWGPHDEHLHHKRRYTRRTLSRRCERAGLSIESMSHFNTLLFPLAVLDRMLRKVTGTKGSATRTPAAPLNALLTRVFALEQFLLGRLSLPFGLSLFLLAQPCTDGLAVRSVTPHAFGLR